MSDSQIADKASFDHIRYAQLWEDGDVLVDALGDQKGKTLVSICSAGDNALAMLTLDPERVVVVDLSTAQIACLKLRISAYRSLDHQQFLELMGSRPSSRRRALLDEVIKLLDADERAFWQEKRRDVELYGAGGIGKFERYFRIFRKYLLPLAQSKRMIDDVFEPRDLLARKEFVSKHWFNWRWNLLLKLFFSNAAMGRLGRDPAFFDHVEGSLSEHVARRIKHAAIDLDPSLNPYLHWILKGTHSDALPLAWRAEHFEIIKQRLTRLDIRPGSLERFTRTGEKADGFNLSDIFEYMDEQAFEEVYGGIIGAASPEARLVYWNMMVPRLVPQKHHLAVKRLDDVEKHGKGMDKAFFYSDFVVTEVLA